MEGIEQTHGVRILYACESGSRAWGFPSPDSDYDVRFIFIHPKERYLSIEEPVEELGPAPDAVLDFKGWELRKLLRLLRSSNATPYEWLQSPIVYREKAGVADRIRSLMPHYFAPRAALHHYLGLTRKTWQVDLQGPEVKLKKYFYALRPLAAAMWVAEKKGVPPMEFAPLRKMVRDATVNDAIDRLLEAKKRASETDVMAPDPVLHDFIREALAATGALSANISSRHTDAAMVNEVFRSLADEF